MKPKHRLDNKKSASKQVFHRIRIFLSGEVRTERSHRLLFFISEKAQYPILSGWRVGRQFDFFIRVFFAPVVTKIG